MYVFIRKRRHEKAIAFLHLGTGNWIGAAMMFGILVAIG
jgi:hypothetical protein